MTPEAPSLIIFSDLDGTLLDQSSYSYEPCIAVLSELKAQQIPVILCSSKTCSEMLPLWRTLRLEVPFIVENGGAIYFDLSHVPFSVDQSQPAGELAKLELGMAIGGLRAVLSETARRLHVQVRGFGAMTIQEIIELTRLPPAQAVASAQREYDEPFIFIGEPDQRLLSTLVKNGFTVSKGDRFYHLSQNSDKGVATRRLIECYRAVNPSLITVALGNSGNDLPMLQQVDSPILVKNPDGSWDRQVVTELPKITRTAGIGPTGWAEAVKDVLARRQR